MKPLLPVLCLAVLPLAVPVTALAQIPDIHIHDGYARGANPKSGAAFMVIDNRGDADCTLTSVRSDMAQRVALHSNRDENGVMKMVAADPIVIAAGARRALVRGGDHVMLMGLTQPLQDGDELALTLDFGDCGVIETSLPVENTRAPAPKDHGTHTGHEAMSH